MSCNKSEEELHRQHERRQVDMEIAHLKARIRDIEDELHHAYEFRDRI